MMAKPTSQIVILCAVTALTIISTFLIQFTIINTSFATTQTDTNVSIDAAPDINASSIFDNHRITLGNNIKNLVILIPNEGHHGQQVDEDRFIDQPFVPQNSTLR